MSLTKVVDDPTIAGLAEALAVKTAEADALRGVIVDNVAEGTLDESILVALGIEVPPKFQYVRVTLDIPVSTDLNSLKGVAADAADKLTEYGSFTYDSNDGTEHEVTVVNFEVV